MYVVPVKAVLNTGLDWFAFSWVMAKDAIIGGCLEAIQKESVAAGYGRKHYGANGYKGWTTGALSVGYRTEGGFCEARSAMALPVFLALQGTPGIRCSRIDIQATIELCNDNEREHENILAALRVAQAAGVAAAPEDAPTYGEDKKGWTQYLGAAKSDKRGRVYDKGAEQRTGIIGRFWRFEYQLRRAYAKAVYKSLCGVASPQKVAANTVQRWLGAIGVHLDIGDGMGTGVSVGRRSATSDEKTMEWLRTAAVPSLYRLLGTTQEGEVRRIIAGLAHAAGMLDVAPEPL